MAYNRDFVAPTLQRRKPQGGEVAALRALDARLAALPSDAPADDIQNIVYEIGKDETYGFAALRDWFRALYETLFGSSAGPRMGSFIALFGIANTRRLIAAALGGFLRPTTGRNERHGSVAWREGGCPYVTTSVFA